jgi:hypothetical protein
MKPILFFSAIGLGYATFIGILIYKTPKKVEEKTCNLPIVVYIEVCNNQSLQPSTKPLPKQSEFTTGISTRYE